jgi:hypothetical protein
MKSKIIILTLTVFFSMSYCFPALGQQSGYYVIPPECQGIISTSMLDSLRAKLANQPKTYLNIDYTRLGKMMWHGIEEVKWSANNPNKIKTTAYSCFENGWLKSDVQFDTSSNVKDYDTHNACYNLQGDSLWIVSIDMEVIDSTSINVKTSVDVKASIYEAYQYSAIKQFIIQGNGTIQNFPVTLYSEKKYIKAVEKG